VLYICVYRAVRGREAVGAEDDVVATERCGHARVLGFGWDLAGT
jgi:hypothetical protein